MNRFRRLICAWFGCSRVIRFEGWGYWGCARCGAHAGDSLGGAFSPYVSIGHLPGKCFACDKNRPNLKWHEKIFIKLNKKKGEKI